MELVTMPVIHDADTAMNFAKELQLLLRTLGVSGASLEKGEMRIEANISVSTNGYFNGDFSKLGTKTEVKNLSSFKIVGAAIDYEVARHIAVLEGELDDKIIQETRGWDENKQATFHQRTKENADDYRYFPDPDIPKYKFSDLPEFDKEELAKSLPELPWERRERYTKDFNIKSEDVEFYLQNPGFGKIFESATKELNSADEYKKLSNYVSSDLAGLVKNPPKELKDLDGDFGLHNIDGAEVAKIIKMIGAGELSSRGAKDLLLEMYKSGGKASEIADAKGLIQKSDPEELKRIIEQIVKDNAKQVEAYKAGNEKLLQYFVGQGMKATKGSANPGMLAKTIKKLLG
jgi:aspartyl-tRNA(Asn)/glutamyl-tRNA(Gln) amidotransferase subunit B